MKRRAVTRTGTGRFNTVKILSFPKIDLQSQGNSDESNSDQTLNKHFLQKLTS